jgi:hypothetical protein
VKELYVGFLIYLWIGLLWGIYHLIRRWIRKFIKGDQVIDAELRALLPEAHAVAHVMMILVVGMFAWPIALYLDIFLKEGVPNGD